MGKVRLGAQDDPVKPQTAINLNVYFYIKREISLSETMSIEIRTGLSFSEIIMSLI